MKVFVFPSRVWLALPQIICVALATLFFPHILWAAVQLYSWQPPNFPMAYVIAVPEGKDPIAHIKDYVAAMEKDAELASFAVELKKVAGLGAVAKLEKDYSRTTVLALANHDGDLSPEMRRVSRVLNPLQSRGAATYVLPMGNQLALNAEDAIDFRTKAARFPDLMMAMGGEDVHPSLFGAAVTYANATRPRRDLAEAEMIQEYLRNAKGFFSGVCRGHQLGGVASGCTMVQDIERETGVHHPWDHMHEIEKGKNAGALTQEFFGESKVMVVRSLHHQAIAGGGSELARVTAFSLDGKPIAEIIEYKNGRGFSVQFHPEMMDKESLVHKRFYDLIFGEAQKIQQSRFQQFKALYPGAGFCTHFFSVL